MAVPLEVVDALQAARYVEQYIAGAKAFRDVQEQGGQNRGQLVEIMQRSVGIRVGIDPWCAAYVSHVGHQVFLDEADPKERKSDWPLPMTGGCAVLGDFAKRKGILVTEGRRGDLFLVYFPSMKRFAHVGIVLEDLGNHKYRTIEGNTGELGEREGYKVALRTRVIDIAAQHRFVRWTDLLVAPAK